MQALTAFEYDRDGSLIVCSDENELLVHSGSDEEPLWADRFPDQLVAIRVRGKTLLAMDQAGHVRVYQTDQAHSGGLEDQPVTPFGSFGQPAVALDCALNTPLAVVLAGSGLYLLPWQDGPRKLSAQTGICVALEQHGAQVALGTEAGELFLYQADGGLLDARLDLHQAVSSVVWHPYGFWLVASGGQLLKVDGRGERKDAPVVLPEGWQAQSLTVSRDGRLLGFRADEHTAAVLSLSQKQLVGNFTYERVVGQVAFGPGRFFGVGLAGGDGNKFDLSNSMIYRTDTFAHRVHKSWVLGVQIDEQLAAGGNAAQEVLAQEPPPGVQAPSKTQGAKGSKLKSVLLALGGILALVLVAYLILLRSDLRSDARDERVLREDIRRSISDSVQKHMNNDSNAP